MSTLADELLQDFEDADSPEEDEGTPGLLQNREPRPPTVADRSRRRRNYTDHDGSMELDDDEEDDENDPDDEMKDDAGGDGKVDGIEEGDDPEDAKAKVEKMHLGGIDDVRSVAGLMKTLEPVLQVSEILL